MQLNATLVAMIRHARWVAVALVVIGCGSEEPTAVPTGSGGVGGLGGASGAGFDGSFPDQTSPDGSAGFDAGGDDGSWDGATEPPVDSSFDVGIDTPMDTVAEAPLDSPLDVMADVVGDVLHDAAPDISNDTSTEAGSRPPGQCRSSADCPGSLTCTLSAPGGLCAGCATEADCPDPGFFECFVGTCQRTCTTDEECPWGMVCAVGVQRCRLISCTTDCPVPYDCIGGYCRRPSCLPNPPQCPPTMSCGAANTCVEDVL
jgi:hypothetical protein